jgi:aminoglycoside phosphotransferase
MKLFVCLGIPTLFTVLVLVLYPTTHSATPKTIDSEYAASLIRKIPGVQEPITVEPLQGGTDSEAKMFLVTSFDRKFVIRQTLNPTKAAREIICQRYASDAGYGPHVYSADPKLGVIVMAHLSQVPIEEGQFSSLRRPRALAEALSAMHKGPSFPKGVGEYETGFFFPEIRERMQRLKTENPHLQSTAFRIEEMISLIEKAISPVMENASCHGDLIPPNLFFSGISFTLIDYGAAMQDDPFFDLATAIVFNCFNSNQKNALLDAYFKRPLSEKEEAKLILARQAVLLKASVNFFIEHPSQKFLPTRETVEEVMERFWLGDALDKQEIQSTKYGHVFLTEAIANQESAEFRQAAMLLLPQ